MEHTRRQDEDESPAYRLPLADWTLELLAELKELTGHSRYLFPLVKGPDEHMSENTLSYLMGRMGYKGIATPHGFRSLATDVLNENGFNSDVVERQLAQRRNHHGGRQTPRRHLQRRHQPSGGIPTKRRTDRLAAKYRPIRSGKQPPMLGIGRVLCCSLAIPVGQ